MKPKISGVDFNPDVGERCVTISLPDDDRLVSLFFGQAFRFLSAPSYYYDNGFRMQTARIFEYYMTKNLLGEISDECKVPMIPASEVYLIPPSCVGQVIWLAVDTNPENYLRCDGRTYKKEQFPQLYAAISPVFKNGDTFTVPDIRNKVIGGVSNDNRLGSNAGANSRLQETSEVAPHDHYITGTTDQTQVPHDHGGNTLSGNSTFYRTVGQAGTSAQSNHVTGFSSGSFVDRTDTNYPLRLHNHDIPEDDIRHFHGLDLFTQSNHIFSEQTPMNMRQRTTYLYPFICAGSLKANGEGMMYFLRQRGSLVEQTTNGGGDFFPAFDLGNCFTDPVTGENVGTGDISIAIDSNNTTTNQIINNTYNYGNWSDPSSNPSEVEEALCSVILVWVQGVMQYLADNPPSQLPAVCQQPRLGLAIGASGAIAARLALIPALQPVAAAFASLSVGLAVGAVLCEIGEEIEPLFVDNSFTTDQNAINEVVCYMSDRINYPVTTVQINESLDGFSGSANAEKIAEVMGFQINNPAAVGEVFRGAQGAVDQAGSSNLPCPCTDTPCTSVDITWSQIPNPPFLPDDWTVGTATYADRPVSFSRRSDGRYQNDADFTNISIRYDFPSACFVNSLTMGFQKSDNSYVVGAFANTANGQRIWIDVASGSFGTPLVQERNAPVGLEVTAFEFLLWSGDIIWNNVRWS